MLRPRGASRSSYPVGGSAVTAEGVQALIDGDADQSAADIAAAVAAAVDPLPTTAEVQSLIDADADQSAAVTAAAIAAAIATVSTPAQVTTAQWALRRALGEFWITDPAYGASTATADNRATIQAAIEAATVFGGKVVIPAGTFNVIPSGAGTYLIARSGVTIKLMNGAVLRVADGTGNFKTLIGQAAAQLRNFAIVGPGKIDTNSASNGGTITGVDGTQQNAVHFYNCDGVTIAGLEFDGGGQNTVIVASYDTADCKNVFIQNNRCRFTRRGASEYDNSFIYVEASSGDVSNNIGVSALGQTARAFIELHNGNLTATGNTSNWFRTLYNVVSGAWASTRLSPNNITISGGGAYNANEGITLWPIAGTELANVTISNVPIYLSQVQHNLTQCWGISQTVSSGLTGTIRNLVIDNCPVYFEADSRTTAAGGAALSGYNMGGILIGGRGAVNGLTVRGCPVYRSPAIGIRIGNTDYTGNAVSAAVVSECPITDAGSNPNAVYRIGLFADGSLTNVSFYTSPVHDTGASSPNGSVSIRAQFTLDTVSGLHIDSSCRVTTTSGSLTESVDWTVAKYDKRSATATLDFGSISAGASLSLNITVPGAAVGDSVAYSAPVGLHTGLGIQVKPTAANTVTVSLFNPTGSAIDPASAAWTATVFKQ